MKKILLLIFLFSGTVYGEWTKTGFGDDSSMFIDEGTIKKNGELVKVTYLQNFPLGTSNDKGVNYKSSKTVEEFDCKNKQSRTVSFEWFSDVMGKGKRVYNDVHTFPFDKVNEGSLLDGIRRKVCK